MKRIILILAFLCFSASLRATDYYVATTGSDSTGDGSVGTPWATILHASGLVTAGDTVHVAAGTYTNTGFTTTTSGTSGAHLAYISDTKWGAHIVSTSSSAWSNQGDYVDITGFDVTTPGYNGLYTEGDHTGYYGNNVHNVRTGVCDGNGGSGINLNGTNATVNGNYVHDNGPSGCQYVHGIYFLQPYGWAYNNISFGNSGFGIQLWHTPTNIVIVNNTIFNNGTGGIVIGNDTTSADYCVVNNNIVYNNGHHGISEQGNTGTNNVYQNNLVYLNAVGNWSLQNGNTHTGDVTANPLFVNYTGTSAGDYHLQSSSPAIGSGTSSGAPTPDYDGQTRPQGASYDIGALEYVSTGTPLSGCLDPMVANTSYYLTSDVGPDPTAVCFGLRNGVTLDLAGYTVTGELHLYGLDGNGIEIFGGTINCDFAQASPNLGCITISTSNAFTAKTHIHNLTVHNANDPGAGNVAAIYLEWDATTGVDGTNIHFEVDHVTGTVASAPTSSRAEFLRVVTAKKVDIHDNDITCSASTAACQGIEAVPHDGYVNGLIHDNTLNLDTNTTAGDTARGITISGPDSDATGTQGWQVYNNTCTAKNNRCFRFRQVNHLTVHDNHVLNCTATAQMGCYHFADPSNGTVYVGDAQADIYNETVALDTGGVAFWVRDGSGWNVHNSTVTGTHGKLWSVETPIQAPPGGPVPTGASACTIAGASSLDVASTAATSTTVSEYSAGAWAGSGTINTPGTCTVPPPSTGTTFRGAFTIKGNFTIK